MADGDWTDFDPVAAPPGGSGFNQENGHEGRTDEEGQSTSGLNRDPITGTPGAHPLGTGAGATSGAVPEVLPDWQWAGDSGLIGAAWAPWRRSGGQERGRSVQPHCGGSVRRETTCVNLSTCGPELPGTTRPPSASWEGRVKHSGRSFDEAESELKANYNNGKSELDPSWQEVRPAARAAWDRVDKGWQGKL
jgi:hypothetical protein